MCQQAMSLTLEKYEGVGLVCFIALNSSLVYQMDNRSALLKSFMWGMHTMVTFREKDTIFFSSVCVDSELSESCGAFMVAVCSFADLSS
mmetsp:Transcript_8560/g.23118  ORF Transcript_8560/g.23118 Transcript_8560/m.23118 type:complete len:89 (-) Transcript_8560:412-678(-)